MSRLAIKPVTVPKGVTLTLTQDAVELKGAKGTLSHVIPPVLEIVSTQEGDVTFLKVNAKNSIKTTKALHGTLASKLNSMVKGVTTGFEKSLKMVGVGYRAAMKGSKLDLSVGFSHPVALSVPQGLTCETPSQTEILIKGCDKQQVGQFAAEIRAVRPPEPYKGKGIRYADEHVKRKETKK